MLPPLVGATLSLFDETKRVQNRHNFQWFEERILAHRTPPVWRSGAYAALKICVRTNSDSNVGKYKQAVPRNCDIQGRDTNG